MASEEYVVINDITCIKCEKCPGYKVCPISKIMYMNEKDELHRDDDQPAVIYPNGTLEWYQNGELHRGGNKPAVIYFDGTRKYYQRGKLHRDGNEPAVLYPSGAMEFFKDGTRPSLLFQ